MKIYIAGPMTGIPEYNFPAFARYAAQLRAKGYEVVSPAEVNAGQELLPPTPENWQACMKEAIKALLTCDSLGLMPGWENSKGVAVEYPIAKALGYKIFHLFPEGLVP